MARGRVVRRRIRPWRLLLVAAVLAAVATLGACSGYVYSALRTVPAAAVEDLEVAQSSFVFDRSCSPGQPCAPVTEVYGPQRRVPVPLSELPDYVPHAFVAIEDERFYQHVGVDARAILRALWNNLLPGRPLQGGSTITQQLARNLFPIGTERTLRRKIQEAVLAVQLERRLPKQKILELYLNQIYFGRGAYGIEAAAQAYFRKSARELTLAQAALLAGLVKSPGEFNPRRNPQGALQRRNLVLAKMAELGFITPQQAEAARAEPLAVVDPPEGVPYAHPWFVDYVIQQLLDHFTREYVQQGYSEPEARERAAQLVYSGGLRIYTTMDVQLQQAAEEAVAEVMDRLFPMRPGQPSPEAALAAVDPATGEILALVGGRQHRQALGFNRAWQAYRQPGSAMKPLAVYAAAFEAGMTPGTVIDDSPVQYELAGGRVYAPRNYDRRYRGLVTVREALRLSINVVAVKVLHQIGIERGFAMARRLGIDSLDGDARDDGKTDLALPLALGGLTRGVSPLDMAQAYAVFASGGVRSEPYAIREVRDRLGRVLYRAQPRQEAVLSPQIAWVMTDVLRNVIYPYRIPKAGTGASAAPADRRPAAGKTGTTSENRDAWFVGYTPDVSAAVWIGYDGEHELPAGASGGRFAGRIWKLFIDRGLMGRPARDFPRPDGIVEATICDKDGLLPGPYCPPEHRYTEVFVAGSEPTRVGDAFKAYLVCAENPQLLYAEGCGCTPVQRVFLDRPRVDPQVEDMALAPPNEVCTGTAVSGQSEFRFRVLADNFEPRVVTGAVAGTELRFVIEAVEIPVKFLLPDLGIEVPIPAGETATVTFKPPKPGWYPFYFDTGSYLMQGRLLVREPAQPAPPAGEAQPPPGQEP